MTGSDTDSNFLLLLRTNLVHYVQIIYEFAPCVVSLRKWKQSVQMERLSNGCGFAFNEILSVSGEAFIVLVLIDYSERWAAEIDKQKKQVSPSNLA